MKNNISKLVLVVFVVIFIIPFNVKAILTKETAPAVNTFTIAQPQTCTVTRNYYYIDETDNRTQAKVSTTNNVYCGNSITLNNGLMNLDYGNTELTASTYVVNSNVSIDEVYYLNRYTIIYNLDGGTDPGNPTVYTEMTGTINITNPTKSGYIFQGWTYTGVTTHVTNLSFNSTDKENKVFTANWQVVQNYTLQSGANFYSAIPSNATTVIFGKRSDYPDVVNNNSSTSFGSTSSDLIYRYVVNKTVYILSDGVIKFNTNSNNLFNGKQNLTSITFDNIDTSGVTNMTRMFQGCRNLTELDLSMFDTSSVTQTDLMFSNSSGHSTLTTIYVSNSWDMSHVTSSTDMFKGATNLVGGNGTTYNASNVDKTYARVDQTGTPGYLTYKAN